jgi:hypothetical protein
MSKQELALALEGVSECTEINPVDDLRYGLMAVILTYWKRVSSQLFCPAKSGDPDACKQCVDAQVVHCIVTNPRLEPEVLLKIRRKHQ